MKFKKPLLCIILIIDIISLISFTFVWLITVTKDSFAFKILLVMV